MTFTKERIIEELKASTQNASGMFEISEDTICALMSLLTTPPAPVSVPDEKPMPNTLSMYAMDAVAVIAEVRGWNACRAAMLQGAEPVRDRHETAGSACKCRSSEKVQALQEVQEQGSPAPDSVQSVAIPDGYALVPVEPTAEMIEATFAGEMELQSVQHQTRNRERRAHYYRAMLAAAPDFREIPDSSTNNCRENAETSTNCPHCGRKRLKNRTCSVAGCEGRHVAHGLCQKHYDIEHKNNLSRRKKIRAANKRYRARKSAAPQQEV